MPLQGVNGTSLTLLGIGGALLYSGIKGKNFGAVAKGFLQGQSPATVPNAYPITVNGTATQSTINSAPPIGTAKAGANVVVDAAVSQLGKPYVWDTPTNFNEPNPASFDCSGLTGWCYAKAGIVLQHFTGDQYNQLSHRPYENAQPGDLVFYAQGSNIYHVAILEGAGVMIEAPDAGIPVRRATVRDQDRMPNVGVFPGAQK